VGQLLLGAAPIFSDCHDFARYHVDNRNFAEFWKFCGLGKFRSSVTAKYEHACCQ